MESRHQSLVSCPLACETNQGLTVPDPNPGIRLKKIIRELYWKILCGVLASVLFMYLRTPPLLPIKPPLLTARRQLVNMPNGYIQYSTPLW